MCMFAFDFRLHRSDVTEFPMLICPTLMKAMLQLFVFPSPVIINKSPVTSCTCLAALMRERVEKKKKKNEKTTTYYIGKLETENAQ